MPLEKRGSGSLTQWIKVCNCNRPEPDKALAAAPINICANCGKRSEIGRAGTLTQWIFRADTCSCDKPSWMAEHVDAADNHSLLFRNERDETSEPQAEFPVDASSFPIDRYAPLKRIGMGANGTVYLCRDRLLKKKVAVKVLNVLTSDQLVAFHREAKATSQFEHPNIVKVLDFGVSGGKFPYMVLEYVDGLSLDELLQQRGAIALEEALPIFVQLCDALAYAHKRNLFHRDVKPANVIIGGTTSGELRAWLIDFGVGVFRQEADAQGSSAAGSPAYMSPDQIKGQSFDERSEIYSLGCMLFEVLTGRLPFDAQTSLELLTMHAQEPPPTLAEANRVIVYSEGVEDIAARCLEKSPDDRFQSVGELRQALLDLEADKTSVTSVVSKEDPKEANEPRSLTPSEQQRGSVLVIACVTMLVLICTISGAYVFRGEQKNHETVIKTRKFDDPQLSDAIDTLESDTWYEGLDGTGNIGWTSGPNLKDEEFKKLLNEKDLSRINVSLTDYATGEGFKYLKGRGVKEISIKSTGLTDEGLKTISQLKSLEVLRICIQSHITESGMASLPSLPNLRGLDLNTMTVPTGSMESVAKIKKLSSMSLYNAKNVTVADIARLIPLQRIHFLDLTGTGLDNSVIPHLVKLKNLDHLRLGKLNLTDENLELLATLPRLHTVWLAHNPRITDAGLEKLSRCQKLRFLVLTGCSGVSRIARLRLQKNHPGIRLQADSDAGSAVIESLEPLEVGD